MAQDLVTADMLSNKGSYTVKHLVSVGSDERDGFVSIHVEISNEKVSSDFMRRYVAGLVRDAANEVAESLEENHIGFAN